MINSIILQDENGGRTHRVLLPCIIGRGDDAQLHFADDTISHRHALISAQGDEIFIQDLGSRNGLVVNGERISEKSLLAPGDSIQLGRVFLRYLKDEPEISGGTVILHASDATTELELDRQRLRWIHEMTLELSENMASKLLGDRITSRLRQVFKFDQFYMGLFQEDGSLRAPLRDTEQEEIPISSTIVNRLLQNGESFILADALGAENSAGAQSSMVTLRIRSAMCVPLLYRGNIYGLIYMTCGIPGVYSEVDLEFLKTIASILGPKIENARLWAEVRELYDNTVETLKKTQSRLMSMERARAYVWLAQAMAHEIRNPLMVIGGMARRLAHQEPEGVCQTSLSAVLSSAERIEAVLKEVDSFAGLPVPAATALRIDHVIAEEIEANRENLERLKIRPVLSISTSRLVAPLDGRLFGKALDLIFREVASNVPSGSDLPVSVTDHKNSIEIYIGPESASRPVFETLDADHGGKPPTLGLFLNLAHKIISEQGGEILLDPNGHSPFPLLIRIPLISEPQP
ncbi:MAG: FHA domain-containing protein [Desulfobacteraceae bacterium]|nr:FHA domain-containing protein [Desulfobacteraceae bacterium]